MSAVALINHNGSQVVIIDNEKIFTLEPNCPTPKERHPHFHVSRYLQPSMNEIEDRAAGMYPYTEAYDYFMKSYAKQTGFRMFKIGIDSIMDLELRTKVMVTAERLFADPDAKAFVLERLLSVPFENDSSVTFEGLPETGNVGDVIKVLREKWGL